MSVKKVRDEVHQKCTRCNLCVKQCGFLQKYGNPGNIADAIGLDGKSFAEMPFECSLCSLCEIKCPAKLAPAEMFLEMRRDAVSNGVADFSRQKALLNYERRGVSNRYSYFALPKNCETIFFPGCTLAGLRPKQTFRLFKCLKDYVPNLGIVLHCCCKPSHDLGRTGAFEKFSRKMGQYLERNAIKKILVACPGCYKIFKNYYSRSVQIETVYEIMSQNRFPVSKKISGSVCVHDPCVVRHEDGIHDSVRHLVEATGLNLFKMNHERKNTLCCGEGGAVNFVNPELSQNWSALRAKESEGQKIITYCAGCINRLNKFHSVSHVLDLVFEPQAALAGKIKTSSPPMTYLNRLFLKYWLKKSFKI